jgi:hypothetical protein
MSTITLVVIPGPGARTVTIQQDTTIEALVVSESLHGREIIINGQGISPSAYATTTIASGSEIFATGSVKGNAKGGGGKGGGRPANAPSGTGRPSGGGRGNNAPSSK